MRLRRAAGALLLALVALSTSESTFDAAARHWSAGQLRVRAPHGSLRAPQRAAAIADVAPAAPEPAPGTSVVAGDAPHFLAPPPASVFVPPRA